MASLAQQEASRMNGAKSHGPTSAEGKNISSQNALKHGLTAVSPLAPQTMILLHESVEQSNEFLQDYMVTFKPTDGVQYDLVLRLATTAWRLKRVPRIEVAEMELFHFEPDPETGERVERGFNYSWQKNKEEILVKLRRYEAQLQREYRNCIRLLKELQRDEVSPASRQELKESDKQIHAAMHSPLPPKTPDAENPKNTDNSQINKTNPTPPPPKRPAQPHYRGGYIKNR